ncbi:spore germination protein [Pseudalkalibacillus caeni]|uniref:Spore germination protein n=1 Tax=Exobacillus caeni TaxID=2574798 RepID=A0A5R9F4K9_9BACL|nr:spore germination protein [Pseudalkalibacillus caeni]TLS35424.1 spore germination protein [Pseudalkalibacillus caeni]
MPSIILGPVKINSVEGVLVTGDSFNTSPKSTSKTFAGSGAFNTGDFHTVVNGASNSNTSNPNVTEGNISGSV